MGGTANKTYLNLALIPFNKPYFSGKELLNISKILESGTLTGDQEIIHQCESFLEKKYGFLKVLLTNSCTTALQMAALLADIRPGDEVIIPSYTFVSTANAFALAGATIVFADSAEDRPHLDVSGISALVTSKTKVIVAMHYGGTALAIEELRSYCIEKKILLVEDAAQCINSFHQGKALGTFAPLSCFSFHETKNIHCGEGGFLAINDEKFLVRASNIRNKGTNRDAFSRGEVSRYEWVDLGFSALPSAIAAGFLFSQLESIGAVEKQRSLCWDAYYNELVPLALKKKLTLPGPELSKGNSHIFYLLCHTEEERYKLINHLAKNNIHAVFHYQSLHSSPFFRDKHDGRVLRNADRFSGTLLRLPMYFTLTLEDVKYVTQKIKEFYN